MFIFKRKKQRQSNTDLQRNNLPQKLNIVKDYVYEHSISITSIWGFLREITSAPWYASNLTLHNNSEIETVLWSRLKITIKNSQQTKQPHKPTRSSFSQRTLTRKSPSSTKITLVSRSLVNRFSPTLQSDPHSCTVYFHVCFVFINSTHFHFWTVWKKNTDHT